MLKNYLKTTLRGAEAVPEDTSATVTVAHTWSAEGETLMEVASHRVHCEHADC